MTKKTSTQAVPNAEIQNVPVAKLPKPLRITVFYSPFAREWYFNIRARNNQIIAQSEGYTRRASALKTAQLFASVGNFEVQDSGFFEAQVHQKRISEGTRRIIKANQDQI